ncbi:MAG: hypothetical protein EAY81_11655 [Bacteroidetes bacterium]|nr:MAG: hypothetical protein EAY81_11655 [Bacteroidota bacterium]
MKFVTKVTLVFLTLSAAVLLHACGNSDNDSDDPQPIVTNDTSAFNGRLKAEIRNTNNNLENNAVVYLYATYPDFINNIPLNFAFSNTNGVVDFGFLLQGNYYLFARNNANGSLTDTAAVQVLSRRETYRVMRLSN